MICVGEMMDILTQLRVLAQGDGEGFANLLFIIVVLVLWAVGGLIRATRKGAAQRQGTGTAAGPRRQTETWQQRLARKAQELQRAAEAAAREATERARQSQGRLAPQGQPAQTSKGEPAMSGLASPQGRIDIREGRRGESILVYERPESKSGTIREQLAVEQREARDAVSAARYATADQQAGLKAKTEREEPGRQEEPIWATSKGGPIMQGPASPEDRHVIRPGRRTELGRLAFEARPPATEETLHAQTKSSAAGSPGEVECETSPEPIGLAAASIFDYDDPDALRKAILHYEILGKPVGLRDPVEQSTPF